MKQGEIWYADLNPVKGSEQVGFRPVLIVSGNLMNEYSPLAICVPLTTKIKNYKGNVILTANKTNGLSENSEVLNFHIRSISKDRLVKKIGNVTKEELNQTLKGIGELLKY
jgi:mRNA interferase MazF